MASRVPNYGTGIIFKIQGIEEKEIVNEDNVP